MSIVSSPSIRTLLKAQTTPTLKSHSCFVSSSNTLLQVPAIAVASRGLGVQQPAVLPHAGQLFDENAQKDPAQINRLLFKYSRENQNLRALNYFSFVHTWGLPFDGLSFSCVLRVCGVLFSQGAGKQLHCLAIKSGFKDDVGVGTSLTDLYMKTQSVDDGTRVFCEMGKKNVVSWTALVAGYARNGLNCEAVEMFYSMLVGGAKGNAFTYATVLGALAADGLTEKGMQIHAAVVKNGLDLDTSVGNSLISMYSKGLMLRAARAVFDHMDDKNSVTWNSMFSAYVGKGYDSQALELFFLMRRTGLRITQFASAIKLCGDIRNLSFTRQLHCMVLKSGFEFDENVLPPLVVAYSKCNEMDDAYMSFSAIPFVKSVVLWTAMITAYLQNGEAARAVHLFCQMCREDVMPNSFTYSAVLTAHPLVSPFAVHAQVIKTNNETLSSVGTSLIAVYFKRGEEGAAARVFDSIAEKDIVSWTAMFVGYAQIGDAVRAVKIFKKLGEERVRPNEYTFSSIINACARPSAAAEQGKQLHGCAIKWGFDNALWVSSALVTMYAKRGNIENASRVFVRQKERDVVSWNSMISGYAQHGDGRKALGVFEEMKRQNVTMDGITFIGVISACAHAGLVEEGERYYNMMVKDHHIEPIEEHYSCMVDLYSRAGMLRKAMDVINSMPFPADETLWLSVLAGCRVQKNLELGKVAAEKLISLNPDHSVAYVLLSNIYAVLGDWKAKSEVRKMMDKRKVKKEAGLSWIEVKNKTYSFLAGDQKHPLSDQIYAKLEELLIRLRDIGYQPDTNYVLHDVDEEYKEAMLLQHSEKLALAFGLISTSRETPLQIVKNVRVCGDCHTFFKSVSTIEEREIVVRDPYRFHHFKGGLCSCGDYW